MQIKNVISISSGKDSTATLLLALETVPKESIIPVFADTGNEHREVYQYLDYLEHMLCIDVVRLRVNFASQIAVRRLFVANDQRLGRKNGRKIRYTNKIKRRILSALHPTGNPYLDLCIWKGRFPSRKAQFCTEFLKTNPLMQFQLSLIESGGIAVWNWQGIRAEESPSRAKLPCTEYAAENLFQYRPILRWTTEQVFAMHRKHGIEPNSLYKQGMSRVGCMPCINASKADIYEMSKRFPEEIARIELWERLVAVTSKRGKPSFFPAPDDGRADRQGRNIREIVQWSRTVRGGRQFNLLAGIDSPACSSAYGLCE